MRHRGTLPFGSTRNGLPVAKPYVYRGTGRDEATPDLDDGGTGGRGRKTHWDALGNRFPRCGQLPRSGDPDVTADRAAVTCRTCRALMPAEAAA